MKYKLLCSDMDHTLLNSKLEISTGNQKVIHSLSKLQVPLILCTGRGVYGVESYVKQLGLTEGYVICQNGGTIYSLPNLELKKVCGFSSAIIVEALAEAQRLDIDIQLYYDRVLMAERISPRIQRYSEVMGIDITVIPDATKYQGILTKCLFNGSGEKLQRLKEKIFPLLQGKVNMFFSDKEFWEITALGVTKGIAMVEMAQELGVRKEEIVAVGDSENDISMLKEAGLGIAVSNASVSVKEASDIVLSLDCDKDAVAHVIQKYFLNREESSAKK